MATEETTKKISKRTSTSTTEENSSLANLSTGTTLGSNTSYASSTQSEESL